MKIGDDKKYSPQRKVWIAIALALIVWALVIGAAILFTGLFRTASAQEPSAPSAIAARSVEAAR